MLDPMDVQRTNADYRRRLIKDCCADSKERHLSKQMKSLNNPIGSYKYASNFPCMGFQRPYRYTIDYLKCLNEFTQSYAGYNTLKPENAVRTRFSAAYPHSLRCFSVYFDMKSKTVTNPPKCRKHENRDTARISNLNGSSRDAKVAFCMRTFGSYFLTIDMRYFGESILKEEKYWTVVSLFVELISSAYPSGFNSRHPTCEASMLPLLLKHALEILDLRHLNKSRIKSPNNKMYNRLHFKSDHLATVVKYDWGMPLFVSSNRRSESPTSNEVLSQLNPPDASASPVVHQCVCTGEPDCDLFKHALELAPRYLSRWKQGSIQLRGYDLVLKSCAKTRPRIFVFSEMLSYGLVKCLGGN
ncbi:hypothetical protein CLF_109284 [Clonorchis sinensis]|uniref:Uncharacterized protein n=1 Tax=Clonorchis sinensis TaxID=79923 RepID=G7YJ59_CLOSI|nr:hypothetical protein CLF_109284 [Clonorchis sinensis]